MDDKIRKAIASIDKKWGKGNVVSLTDEDHSIKKCPSGSMKLDLALGGGYPYGRIIEAYGPESSGKSTVALHACAEAQKQNPGRCVAYIDTEYAFDSDYAEALGVDLSPERFIFVQPEHGEQAFDIIETFLKTGEFSMIVVDSVAAMIPRAELEGEMGESKMGLHARLMSQGMRKLTGLISKSDCILFFINQLRDKVGVLYGCFDYNSRIRFYDGTSDYIGNVVNKKIDKPILCLDKDGNQVEGKILNWFKNSKSRVRGFLSFEIERGHGNGRIRFRCTPNHLIFTDRGEISAGDLREGDLVKRQETYMLNEDQFQVALASCFGDGHLYRKDSVPKIVIQHGPDQKEYCKIKHDWFSEAACDLHEYKSPAYEKDFVPEFRTKALPEFIEFNRKWISKINAIGLAVLFMDDGTIAGNSRDGFRGEISTPAARWSLEEKKLLSKVIMEKTGAKASVCPEKIHLSPGQFNIFSRCIVRYVPECMRYKLHPHSRDIPYEGIDSRCRIRKSFGYGKVRSISEWKGKSVKFDIETNYHNYCIDGAFVHNSPETTTGGNALKFYASQRLDIRRIKTVKTGDESIANEVRVTVKKNKVAPPFRKAEITIVFGKGIDTEGEILDVALEAGVIENKGAYYYYNGERLAQGMNRLKDLLEAEPELYNEIKDATLIAIKENKINIEEDGNESDTDSEIEE